MANNFKAVLAPVLWVVFGIVGLLITLDYMGPLPTFELGAAFWPQVILVGIILVSFIQILSIFFSRSTTNQITSDPLLNGEAQSLKEADEAVFLNVNVRTLAIFLLPLVYVYGMHQFGFFLVTPVFLPLYMYVMGVREVKKIFFVSLGFYGMIIFLFVHLVFTPLPQGAGAFHSLNGQFLSFFQ